MPTNYNSPYCYDTRHCFAANYVRNNRVCRILIDTYQHDGDCPFCKANEAEVVNAKWHRLIQNSGFMYSKIAAVMGISPEYMSTIMSKPLSDKNIVRLKLAIKELKKEREKND